MTQSSRFGQRTIDGTAARRGLRSPRVVASASVFVLAMVSLVATSCVDGSTAGSATKLNLTIARRAASTNQPIVAQTSSVPQTTSSDGKSDCGGVTMDKPDGTPWVCTFDDEFDGTTLNTNNWTVVQTADTGYRSGNECYVDTPNNVNVSGGTLNLTLIKQSAFVCKSLTGGGYMTNYTAGAVNSDMNFSQTYGYFQVKAKFPAATIKGIQTSLWLWPVNDTYYGSKWPASGEMDIAEWYSQYPNLAIPYIHYNPQGGKAADPNVTNNNCQVTNTNGYNTYAEIWTPQTITMLIDGQVCVSDNWNPAAPEVKPDPFNMPFFINLTTAMGVGTNNPPSNVGNELPATSNIDYVRVWS